MLIGYIYVAICALIGLVYSVIGPNFVGNNMNLIYPYLSLSTIYFIIISGLLIGILGLFSKDNNLRKNLLLISAFIILGFIALYFGFIIGIFKEYTFYYS